MISGKELCMLCRCPKGNAAEAVAEKLDKKLRDNLKDARNSLFTRWLARPHKESIDFISKLQVGTAKID